MIDPLGDGISQVTLIDKMGDDLRVVDAARVSFNKQSEWEEAHDYDPKTGRPIYSEYYLGDKDVRLINYLARHNHWTPFSHVMFTFRIKMPIFVARQWYKHQVGFTRNEVSRRYVDDNLEFYVPDRWRLRAENKKQGSSDEWVRYSNPNPGHCFMCGGQIPEDSKRIKYCSKQCSTEANNTLTDPLRKIYSHKKSNAKRKGVEFSIAFEEIHWPIKCPVLGFEIDYSFGNKGLKPNSPSFDRIDPNKGYIPGNVQIISNQANMMKSHAGAEDLVKFAEWVLLTNKGYVPNYSRSPEGLVKESIALYNHMVDDLNIAPEMARMVLPSNLFTEFYETASLAGYARLCGLRDQSDTQLETQKYAQAISSIIQDHVPVSWEALTK